MKQLLIIVFIATSLISKIAAQQNWAAIPCSKMKNVVAINKMLFDSLHNEIILLSVDGSKICNTTYKGVFAYNDNGFHDLDLGVNTHDPNAAANSMLVWDCITYGNKTLFGGGFRSVGTNTLYARSLALWNGAVWDTFPTRCFPDAPNRGGGFYGFVKWNNKLWMYGGFDTIGHTVSKNLTAYDGYTFTAIPSFPSNDYLPIVKMIVYKNKLIAMGNFDDYPASPNFCRLAQFDGTSWTTVGTGIQGNLANATDMTIYNDTLYIAGSFSKSAGNAGNYLMKWDGNQLYDAGFGGFCGYGAIWRLLPFKNRLYTFGGFGCAAGQKAFGVAFYENGTWTVPQDSIEGPSITGAEVYKDAIYIGGGFKSINGDTTIQKFAKLVCPDFDATSGCISGLKESFNKLEVKVFPNPAKSKLYLEFEQSIVVDRLTIYNPLGQEVYRLSKPLPNQEIDISNLPAGIFFLKAENTRSQGVFKIMKE